MGSRIVKDVFWAGMSTTQRSESMNAYFDGYVHSNTTLKEFVEQYENALRKKVEKEEEEDARCFNKQGKNVSPYGFEDQFQNAYTLAKYKEFQVQVAGKIACDFTSMKEENDGISKYEIEEDIKIGEKGFFKTATFHVCYNEESKESNCACRLFESKGIVCKHIVMVWTRKKLKEVPEKYILRRWSKNVRRSHTWVKISYANWERNPQWRLYDLMLAAFHKAADKAINSEAKCKRVVAKLQEAELENESEVFEEQCQGNGPMSIGIVDEMKSSEEKKKPVRDPTKNRRKGRPLVNRKQPRIEKIIRKIKQSKKNGKGTQGNGKTIQVSKDYMDMAVQNVHTTPIGEVMTQESVNYSTSQTVGPQISTWSYQLNEAPNGS